MDQPVHEDLSVFFLIFSIIYHNSLIIILSFHFRQI